MGIGKGKGLQVTSASSALLVSHVPSLHPLDSVSCPWIPEFSPGGIPAGEKFCLVDAFLTIASEKNTLTVHPQSQFDDFTGLSLNVRIITHKWKPFTRPCSHSPSGGSQARCPMKGLPLLFPRRQPCSLISQLFPLENQ